MFSNEIRQKFLDFFKKCGHAIVPSSSLLPNDSSVLLTTAGMQQMVPYLLGGKHLLGKRIADSQKCFRSQDIEEVGDNRHTTFFEMLGNWSFGDYFKKEQIPWIFDFLVNEIGLNPKNFYVTVFRGNDNLKIPRDDESVKIWKETFLKIGIDAKAVDFSENNGMQSGRIFYYDETKNWWSRFGAPEKMPFGELGGPNSEMFWDFGAELKIHENSKFKNQHCHVNCDCGRFLELGNNVFIEYIKIKDGFDLLPNKNVDFGGGLERITAAENNTSDIFEIDLFKPIINEIRKYTGSTSVNLKEERIIVDHIRGAVFLIADGVLPSNVEQGYILRRVLRRAIRYGKLLNLPKNFLIPLAQKVIEIYQNIYSELKLKEANILMVIQNEEEKFEKTLDRGLSQFDKLFKFKIQNTKFKIIESKEIFDLFQTYGFPLELTKELAQEKGFKIDEINFDREFKKHQEISKHGLEQKFKGGLARTGDMETKYHTATHLLLASLRKILGGEIMQKGSNITFERMRFDFNWPEKVSVEKLQEVEDLVNQEIVEKIPIEMLELPKEEAKKIVTTFSFDLSKYGDIVKVYKIGNFSAEFCGGPHVKNTSELGHFKIIKQESCSAGIRRIKAMLTTNNK